MKQVNIYTDGACSGNPGRGGWGALLIYQHQKKELSGGAHETTNNRMELMAAIMALKHLKEPCKVALYTDSQYVQLGMKEWLKGWKKRGWKTADNKPVKNADLWQALDAEAARHEVHWHWVRGHDGHPENEYVDLLARSGIPK